MSEGELLQVFSSVPSSQTAYRSDGWLVTEFLASNAVTGSKSEAVRLIKGGGISVNGQRVADEKARVSPERCDAGAVLRGAEGEEGQFPGAC